MAGSGDFTILYSFTTLTNVPLRCGARVQAAAWSTDLVRGLKGLMVLFNTGMTGSLIKCHDSWSERRTSAHTRGFSHAGVYYTVSFCLRALNATCTRISFNHDLALSQAKDFIPSQSSLFPKPNQVFLYLTVHIT